VVEIFPNPAAFLRLATTVVIESHDEWQLTRRHVSDVSMDEMVSGHTPGTRFISRWRFTPNRSIPSRSIRLPCRDFQFPSSGASTEGRKADTRP